MDLSLKDKDWEEDVLKIQYKLNDHEERLLRLEKTCCREENILRQSIEFETAMKTLNEYNLKIDELDSSFKRHEKILHILIGILITLEFLGVGEQVKALLH